ncbi:MAG TPA: hypothetical protein VI541_04675 [Actinomycetota bacterium]|nr:hypothetical protein [Actinomycetota bacterium]
MRIRSMLSLVSVLALIAVLPAGADTGDVGNPAERYVARPAGVEKDMTFFFGPYNIPPGQDLNRITLDVPLSTGFYTAIAPNLVDAVTGEEPAHQVAHIHHAHWLQIVGDSDHERYPLYGPTDPYVGLSWVFGTGEEKTQGSLNDRADADPLGPRYGMFIDGSQPQSLIFMVHNKTSGPLNVYILLEVRFAFGTRDEIKNATGCLLLLDGESCVAGKDFHSLTGKLWGTTFDVPRGVGANGTYVHPRDIPPSLGTASPLGRFFTAGWNGTAIAGAGHLHPLGKEVVLVNLGSVAKPCADLDNDGYAGITIFHSRKMERVPEANFTTEDYQMGATKPGFRTPIRQGDRIAQFGVYRNDENATYEAMSYSGLYVDKLQVPTPLAANEGCTLANHGSYLINPSGPADLPTEGMLNHAWHGSPDTLCEVPGTIFATVDCNRDENFSVEWPKRQLTDTVHIANFLYSSGDRSVSGPLRVLPQVKQGSSIRFINEDAALVIRHSVTSCPFPCNGPYVANYPLPDGVFESHVLGNIDPINGAPDNTKFDWKTPTDLSVGVYSYFCRIHPTMRGVFEVIA